MIMKKNGLLFLLVVFLFSSCTQEKKDIAAEVVLKLKSYESLHFQLSETYYYSNGADTTVTPYEVWVVRDEADSLRNAYVWVDNNYRPYNMIYSGGDFFLAIPPKQTTVVYPNYTESFISDVDWIDVFLKPEILQNQMNDSLNIVSVSDTVFDGVMCDKIVILFPENTKNERRIFTYVLSSEQRVPVWAEMQIETADYTYFDELYFSDFEFNSVAVEQLKEREKEVFAANPIDDDRSNSELSSLERMLHIGDVAPLFEGKFYMEEADFQLADYVGKNVIIVDFWYTHCPPCVKAIPALSDLQKEYGDKGLKIFGLNSVDNQPRSLDNLNKFLQKREMSYDVIMTQPAVDIMYKINGYPSMYIIDKEGEIAFVEIGYDAEKFEVLKQKVEELLEN